MSRFDRWSRDGMPSDAENAAIQRGIDQTMREIVANRHIPTSASMIPDPPRGSVQTPRAVSAETPLRPPPGIDIIDRMCDAQDRRDKLAAIQQAADLREIERRLKNPEPRGEYGEYNPFDRAHMKR